MPALKPTGQAATITWLGIATGDRRIRSEPGAQLKLGFAGVPGDVHAGRTRPACVRVSAQHARGTEIANTRQLSILGAEEMAEIAATLGLDALDPGLLGATMVVSGLADFSHLPPSARLQAPSGATLVIDMQNRPCRYPGDEIEAERPGKGRRFARAAAGRRGVTAWVERPGAVALGDVLSLHIPDQRPWGGAAEGGAAG